ncbi:TonB-dependent receptor [Methylophilus sp. YYY-1]|uniref:TonB-dependent receptor domain-containing protein n=1 Tax=Methylophilus sp. YYY-1 TaxID=2682087 RepID=UPI0023B341D3|nr:TonB-dependent receptor [Methylophilus sp. YYY-1]MDF0377143.1 TonB-dependent receptor plug domain-containing protein [Methylophilus sp. YYY-1]
MHTPKKLILGAAIAACFSSQPTWLNPLWAAELNTKLPQSEEDVLLSQKITINLPAQPLSASLKALSAKIGLNITYNDKLVSDKQAPALSGTMRSKEALQKLLANTGLEAKLNDNTLYIQRLTKVEAKEIQLDKVEVRAKRFYEVGPLPGLGLTKEEIPGNVQSISAKEIKEAHSLSLTDLMNRKLQSVTVNDYQGNPFQMDVQYRGFTAGPQIGTPQGLSVFIDGIRVNEPFGDIVNWDMIPMNALASVDVFPGSNPIFGLNTLGGAFSLKTKDGFNNAGADAEILTGSFGRKQLQVEGGWNNGTAGLFAAGNFFLEDGWRQNSPSKVNQLFSKASFRGDKLDLNLSSLLVQTNLVGNGLYPTDMYERDKSGIFTAPDRTKNKLGQFQLSGSYFVNDEFTVTGQIYRRNSDRDQKGADVYMADRALEELDTGYARKIPLDGEPYTCLYKSTNGKGMPDYFVLTIDNPPDETGGEYFSDPFVFSGITNATDLATAQQSNQYLNVTFNGALDPEYERAFKEYFKTFASPINNYLTDANSKLPPVNGPTSSDYNGDSTYATFSLASGLFMAGIPDGQPDYFVIPSGNYFYTNTKDSSGNIISIHKNYVIPFAPINNTACQAAQLANGSDGSNPSIIRPYMYRDPVTNNYVTLDGAYDGSGGVVYEIDPNTGKRYYTPTAVFTNNRIEQTTNGASIQLNWNLEKHKFMIGASIDAAKASYSNKQQLGLLDANRNAYLAPDDIHPMFTAADETVSNNDFSGINTTKSVYFSETWSPIETLHLSASGRYNQTKIKNTVATRYGTGAFSIGQVLGLPTYWDICTSDTDCQNYIQGYKPADLSNQLDPAETEQFSYYSFNPSLGATWQANPNLNVYVSWAQGTRTPSVIELGCALDKTPVGGNGTLVVPKSLAENRECSLPTTLSGDPFLPQIRATTYDIGMRGSVWGEWQWNLGAYQTDLKNDIYFVSVGNGQGFFDTVGSTRRRGIESGISGTIGKARLSLNYAMTQATFEDKFNMFSLDNSSAGTVAGLGNGVIQVEPGDKMPGVSLHNLNASLNYDVTDKWTVGLSAVAHSESYLRGNENNDHQQGVASVRQFPLGNGGVGTVTRQPATNPGKIPGYATFNFQTSYKLSKEWTANMIVSNLFDKEYFSAGRLGVNPFSPSINGSIGVSGYNHNSSDWLSTNFIAPGAPRGIWFSLNWHFVPD